MKEDEEDDSEENEKTYQNKIKENDIIMTEEEIEEE